MRDLELTIGLDKRVRALTVDLKESERRREVLLADLAASQSEVELYHQRLQQLEADVSKRIYLASQQADINLSDLQRRHDKLRMVGISSSDRLSFLADASPPTLRSTTTCSSRPESVIKH